jgi:hypothetical protein
MTALRLLDQMARARLAFYLVQPIVLRGALGADGRSRGAAVGVPELAFRRVRDAIGHYIDATLSGSKAILAERAPLKARASRLRFIQFVALFCACIARSHKSDLGLCENSQWLLQ